MDVEVTKGSNRRISGSYALRKVLHMRRFGIPANLTTRGAARPDWKKPEAKNGNGKKH